MRIVILIVLVIFGLAAVACTSEAPSPADTQTASPPTPDIPATVEASILSTREAETGIDATVKATVAATLATSTPTPAPPAGSFVSVSAGGYHTCEVMGGGSVDCWGSDYYGQATPPAGSFVSVSAGWDHTCGVRSDGSVACWGWNESGRSTPPAGSFTSVSAGGYHTCGIRSDGSVDCWGSNFDGLSTPPAGSFTSVSAGIQHNCGVRSDGSVDCWGSDESGQTRAPAGSFVSASAGNQYTCGIRSDGSVDCWGSNFDGLSTPPAGSFISVSAGNQHTCGVMGNGSVACWGSDEYGQATPPAGSFVSVSAGNLHTCGVRSDESVACWGSDEYGQAAPPAGSFSPTPAPTPEPEPTTPTVAPTSDPTPTPAAMPLSLDEYLKHCAPLTWELSYDATNGDFSSLFAAEADRLEALTPPAQLSEWHLLNIENYRTLQVLIDMQPRDDVVDSALLPIVFASLDEYREKLGKAAARLPEDVRQQMIEARCIDPEDLPSDNADGSDDRGNGFESATRIAIGEAVAIELEDLDEEDVLVFLAEPGRDYVITLDWETYQVWDNPGSIMALYDASGQELARLNNYDFSSNRSRNKIMWRAVTGGDYYILVGDENTLGTFTLTVTGGEETEQLDRDDHGDDIDDATAAALGVDVEGVIDYEGDSDYFRFTAEEGRLYQIDVTLGTLPDSYLTLYVEMVGPETWRVEPNDDYGDSQGSRVVWEATESGDYYIRVNGGARSDQVGSYTLTVSVSDDDHGGSASDASAVTVGESIEGAVNYLGDEDVFLFQVEAGAIYEIEVTLGTLADSDLVVYDEPDEWKGRSYSPVLSVKTHRNVWRSEYTGDSYLVVGFPGNESGSYTVRVARITLTGNTSYDTDGDGLIEVSSLMQLNAVRWDLDGDGLPDSSSGMAGFAAAFPGALDGMGCPNSECSGYELITDLDFDTNGNGRADAGDDYWNDGEGWAPIGDDFEADFESSFNGGGYTISNLYIDRRDARYVGLFGKTSWNGWNVWVGLNNNIRDLALVNVDVQGGTYTGGLVGSNGLVIAACSVTGVVRGSLRVGGLVGSNFSGRVIASYSAASVGDGTDTGGLVGSNFGGRIIASYSIGSVSDYNGASSFVDVGGLVGSNFADQGTTRDSYWDTQTSSQSESAGGEGKTTSELQSPTGYTGIYENWNVDLDENGVGDDLWDFGDASQYPTLRHRP